MVHGFIMDGQNFQSITRLVVDPFWFLDMKGIADSMSSYLINVV